MSVKFVLDAKSELTVRPPRKDADVLQLGARYLAYEAAQPLESQNLMPPLVDMQAAYQAARTAADNAASGEHSRAGAGGTYNQTMAAIQDRLQWALNGRARQFNHNLGLIEAWGVDTVMGARERRLDYPTTRAGWRALLDSYIAKEESLLPAEQWSDPPLSEFETLREQMETSDLARTEALNKRRQGVMNRKRLAAELKEDLNLALYSLIRRRFNGVIELDLANWGYDVCYKQSTTTSQPAEGEPTPVGETTPEGEPAPTG